MRPVARSVHLVVAWLLVAGPVTRIFLAGLGVFRGPANFATHRDYSWAARSAATDPTASAQARLAQ